MTLVSFAKFGRHSVRRRAAPVLVPLLSVAFALTVTGCGGSSSASPHGGSGSAPYKIDLVADMTGDASTVQGVSTAAGVLTAVDAVNAAGGVNGRKIDLQVRDSQSSTTGAQSAVRSAIGDNPVAIINGTNSSLFPVSVPLYTRAKIPVFADVTEAGLEDQPWFFLVTSTNAQYTDEYVGAAQQLIGNLSGKKVALEGIETPSIDQIIPAIANKLKAEGATVVDTERLPIGATSFASQAQKIVGLKPDIVLSVEGPNIELVVKSLRSAGYTGPMVGSEGASGTSTFQTIGGTNYYATSPTTPLTTDSHLYKTAKKYGHEPTGSYVGAGWEMVYSIVAALEKCDNSCGPTAFTKALTSLGPINIPGNVVVAPPEFTPKRHYGVTKTQVVHWDPSSQKVVPFGQPFSVS